VAPPLSRATSSSQRRKWNSNAVRASTFRRRTSASVRGSRSSGSSKPLRAHKHVARVAASVNRGVIWGGWDRLLDKRLYSGVCILRKKDKWAVVSRSAKGPTHGPSYSCPGHRGTDKQGTAQHLRAAPPSPPNRRSRRPMNYGRWGGVIGEEMKVKIDVRHADR